MIAQLSAQVEAIGKAKSRRRQRHKEQGQRKGREGRELADAKTPVKLQQTLDGRGEVIP